MRKASPQHLAADRLNEREWLMRIDSVSMVAVGIIQLSVQCVIDTHITLGNAL